jgi:hypothetical protein
MIAIEPALVTVERLNRGTREELENKNIKELLKDVQPSLLQANDYEYAGDIQLKEGGKNMMQGTLKKPSKKGKIWHSIGTFISDQISNTISTIN